MAAPMNQASLNLGFVFQKTQKTCIFTRPNVLYFKKLFYSTRRGRESGATEFKQRTDKAGYRILENVIVPPVRPMFNPNIDNQRFDSSKFVFSYDKRPPRFMRMPVNQDWTNVWPNAHTFKWSAVPLPVRQGQLKSKTEAAGDGLQPHKYCNLELMKIPNFLHLTPDHIKKHCQAIKKFTTPWPSDLDRDKFPVEIITKDYCFAGPSIRDNRARVVTIKFPLKSLKMDPHGEDKFIKLVGHRYNKKTGYVTMTENRCPMKTQNLDFLTYQLTALFFESMTVEPWEELMTEEDMFHTPWGSETSKKSLEMILRKDPEDQEKYSDLVEKKTTELETDLKQRTEAKPVTTKVYRYKIASEQMLNEVNDKKNIDNYKQAVLDLLKLNKETSPHIENKNAGENV